MPPCNKSLYTELILCREAASRPRPEKIVKNIVNAA